MKQEAPQPRRSRTGIPAIHGGEHVKHVSPAPRCGITRHSTLELVTHF
jgi:hypothetical protein